MIQQQTLPSRSEDLAAYSEAAGELWKDEDAPASTEDALKNGTKVAGVFDFLKPGKYDGISSSTAVAIDKMDKEGYYGNPAVEAKQIKPSPDSDTGVDDAIRAAKSRDDAEWVKSKSDDLRKITPGKSDQWYLDEAKKRLKAR